MNDIGHYSSKFLGMKYLKCMCDHCSSKLMKSVGLGLQEVPPHLPVLYYSLRKAKISDAACSLDTSVSFQDWLVCSAFSWLSSLLSSECSGYEQGGLHLVFCAVSFWMVAGTYNYALCSPSLNSISVGFSWSCSNYTVSKNWFLLGLAGLISLPSGDSQDSSPTPHFKSIISSSLSFLYGATVTSIHDYWKNHSFD